MRILTIVSKIYSLTLVSCATGTAVWQKWRFSAPQTVLWFIKVWFSAATFEVKFATFAKPQNVGSNNNTKTNRYETININH
jgi:hypothetical protein